MYYWFNQTPYLEFVQLRSGRWEQQSTKLGTFLLLFAFLALLFFSVFYPVFFPSKSFCVYPVKPIPIASDSILKNWSFPKDAPRYASSACSTSLGKACFASSNHSPPLRQSLGLWNSQFCKSISSNLRSGVNGKCALRKWLSPSGRAWLLSLATYACS